MTRDRPSELQYLVLLSLAERTPMPRVELTRTITSLRSRGWVRIERGGFWLMPAGRHAYRVEWRRRHAETQT